MRPFFFTIAFCATLVGGYVNILLVGPLKETYPLAKHYSDFYNVPIFENTVFLYPQRFVMISEENKQVKNTMIVHLEDYPHKQKNPNYFISWVKQTFST